MRVLLIEDDRMVGAAVAQALRDAAYAVDWVTDGETAIHRPRVRLAAGAADAAGHHPVAQRA